MKLTREILDNFLAVALEDLPAKNVGSACLGTAIIAATEYGMSREQFLKLVAVSYDILQKAGGVKANADSITAVEEGSQN